MKYLILQLKDITKVNYAFMSYEFALKYGFSINDYEVVYRGELKTARNEKVFTILDAIFMILNTHRPEDFKGHSLSVSDIIILENGDMYYVDTVGFQLIKLDA